MCESSLIVLEAQRTADDVYLGLLFRAQVVGDIEQILAASSGWEIRLPALSLANLAAASECLGRAASADQEEP